MAGVLSIRCEAGDFERLRPRTDHWDTVLHDTLRAELGGAARPAARTAARAALRSRFPAAPPARHPHPRRSTGLRSQLASSVTVVLRDSSDGVEYQIKADHPMAAATNATRWRHPVYGQRDDPWMTQLGSRWWSRSMVESEPAMRQAASRALERAARRL